MDRIEILWRPLTAHLLEVSPEDKSTPTTLFLLLKRISLFVVEVIFAYLYFFVYLLSIYNLTIFIKNFRIVFYTFCKLRILK